MEMELMPRCREKVVELVRKGVNIPNPLTLDVGSEVNTRQISGKGVTLYPGCRIYGEKTVISAGAKLGHEAPVTIEDCQIGPNVELKGGFFSRSVFLDGANMGLGAHVREGSILEEEANGAHCVGLKQTILFPFVTLGSLINFCDCLMAGGTSRKDHSEVGSSYIHFNYTPDGDKTTASLIGDVPRGVMLNQPPIFLGGQGGMVGPARIGYGNVVAAGSVLRNDYVEDGTLIFEQVPAPRVRPLIPSAYPNFLRIIGNNILYLASLTALEKWYVHVRRPYFECQELGEAMYAGLLEKIGLGRQERLKRLAAMAKKVLPGGDASTPPADSAARKEFRDNIKQMEELFNSDLPDASVEEARDVFLSSFAGCAKAGEGYIATVQSLPEDVSDKGSAWLQAIIDSFCAKAAGLIPSAALFCK